MSRGITIIFNFIRLILTLLFLSVILLPVLLLGYAMSDTAWVALEHKPSHYDIARVKQILKQYDPRQLKQGQTTYASFSEQDINLLLISSLSVMTKTRAKTHVSDDAVKINLTFKLPDNFYAQYANISLSLKNTPQRLLMIENVNFGTLSIPGWLAAPVWDIVHQYFYRYEEYQRLTDAVQQVRIRREQLIVVYQADWKAFEQLKQRGQALLLTDSERKRVRFYQQKLAQIGRELSHQQSTSKQDKKYRSFSYVLQPMFQLALKRSSAKQNLTAQANSAIEENKALLFVLAMYAAGKNIDVILGKSVAEQSGFRYRMPKATLRNRMDLMQHFSISAFLAAAAGDALAHATGLFKEVSDANGGSGFSFADLAADRAGVEFGTMAVASESRAYFLQQQMSKIINEDDYMPKIDHLPEGLQAATFKRLYGTTESARYKKMQYELDRRIEQCRLYKQ